MSKTNPDQDGKAGLPILVALGSQGGQVVSATFDEGGGGYAAYVKDQTVTFHGTRSGGPSQPGEVRGGVDLRNVDQAKVLEAIMDGNLRPPGQNETYFPLVSQRLNWLKTQFPEQLGNLPDVSSPSTLTSGVVDQLPQWRDKLGLPRVGADKLVGPDLIVAMNGLISQTNHPKAQGKIILVEHRMFQRVGAVLQVKSVAISPWLLTL